MKIVRGFFVLLLASMLLIGTEPTVWAEDYWTADPNTGCQIAWVSDSFTLVSASWTGLTLNDKAEGNGILMVVIRDKEGKENKGKADAEMKAGKLDGKVSIKWSDNQFYDGFYKAGLKNGKGLYRRANGTIYDGDWVEGHLTGVGVIKWPNRIIYEGELKNGVCEGRGVMRWPDGRVYDGEWKAGKPLNPVAAAQEETNKTDKQQVGNRYFNLIYDSEVSTAIRKNAQKVVDVLTSLLTRYGLLPKQPVQVIVTADTEGFINAVASMINFPRDSLEKEIGTKMGISVEEKRTIIVRGHPRQATHLSELCALLPHEAFHQVMRQFSKVMSAYWWLEEGSAEYLRSLSIEEARVGTIDVLVNFAEQKIQKAASIPNTQRLVDHKEYNHLSPDFPTYPMSLVMVSRLIGDKDFGKVVSFYRLLDSGKSQDKSFSEAFGTPISTFMDEMNDYFNQLRTGVR